MSLPSTPLVGRHVRLEPLLPAHAAALVQAASMDRTSYALTLVPRDLAEAERYVLEALAAQEAGRALPYATVRLADETVVGSTRLAGFEYWAWPTQQRPERSGPDALEIGWTWLSPEAQRTPINGESKLLLLTHAFDVLGVERVMLKTDARNARSRAAILRIGASFEGILRRHMPAYDGGVRDTAMFSIVADEWPRVREALTARLSPR